MFGQKRIVYAFGIAILVLAILIGATYLVKPTPVTAVSPQEITVPTQLPQPLTLLEAWVLLDARAKSWQSNAGITSIQSVDVAGDTASSGQDGRRRAWLAYLLDPKSSTDLVVRLIDGVITEEFTQHADLGFQQIISKPSLDSPKALEIVRAAKPNFEPAADTSPAEGFHFSIQGKPNEISTLTVGGYFRARPAFVRLDIATSNVVEALSQTYAPLGGILYSSDAGQTWQASNLTGRMVTAIYPDPLKANRAYASAIENGSIVIYFTDDAGHTWNVLGNLPNTAGDWNLQLGVVSAPARVLRLVVGTSSGLWTSENGKTWTTAPGLPNAPVQWFGPVRSDSGDRLFVSITSGQNPGVYASSDLLNWKQVVKGNYRLSQSFDRRAVLATDEFQIGKSMLLTALEEKASSVPGSALRAAGDFNDPASMILDDWRVGVGKLSNQQVNPTGTLSGASLAVPPDFPSSHIVVLGGFRTGIFRSVDAGRIWVRILADPSKIVPGNNEIYDVQFLSNTFVIAVNGGELTWQSF